MQTAQDDTANTPLHFIWGGRYRAMPLVEDVPHAWRIAQRDDVDDVEDIGSDNTIVLSHTPNTVEGELQSSEPDAIGSVQSIADSGKDSTRDAAPAPSKRSEDGKRRRLSSQGEVLRTSAHTKSVHLVGNEHLTPLGKGCGGRHPFAHWASTGHGI